MNKKATPEFYMQKLRELAKRTDLPKDILEAEKQRYTRLVTASSGIPPKPTGNLPMAGLQAAAAVNKPDWLREMQAVDKTVRQPFRA